MRIKYQPRDFEARINNGLLLYKGKPYQAQTTENMLYLTNTDGVRIEVKPDDPDIDLASPKIGYVNRRDRTVYLYRHPYRRYKQTLTHDVVSGWIPFHGVTDHVAVATAITSKNFEKMLNNDYPNALTALTNLRKENKLTSVAVERSIAMALDSFGIVHVFYKMDEVGTIKPNTTIVHVPKSANAWIVSKYLDGFGWEID